MIHIKAPLVIIAIFHQIDLFWGVLLLSVIHDIIPLLSIFIILIIFTNILISLLLVQMLGQILLRSNIPPRLFCTVLIAIGSLLLL